MNKRNMFAKITLSYISAPKGLTQRILLAIAKERRQRAWRWLVLSSLGSLGFVGLMVIMLSQMSGAFAKTGTWSYLTLLFSDFQAMLANWQEFSLSLLASLPIGDIILTCVTLFGVTVSLVAVFKNVSRLNSLSNKNIYGY